MCLGSPTRASREVGTGPQYSHKHILNEGQTCPAGRHMAWTLRDRGLVSSDKNRLTQRYVAVAHSVSRLAPSPVPSLRGRVESNPRPLNKGWLFAIIQEKEGLCV